MRQTKGISESVWNKCRAANRKAGGWFYENTNRSSIISTIYKNGVRYLLENYYSHALEKTVVNVWRHGVDNRVKWVGASETVDGAVSTAKVYDEWQ